MGLGVGRTIFLSYGLYEAAKGFVRLTPLLGCLTSVLGAIRWVRHRASIRSRVPTSIPSG